MIRNIIILSLLTSLLVSCTNNTKFEISDTAVGPIKRTTKISEIEKLFPNDSVVSNSNNTEIPSSTADVMVYEKGGNALMKLSPSVNQDDQTIKFIQIFDGRYQTDEGIGLQSTFKDIQETYTIKRIDNLINTFVIFVEEGDEYFTIDKKHLSTNLMFDTDTKIEASQIPDAATIKYLMIGW